MEKLVFKSAVDARVIGRDAPLKAFLWFRGTIPVALKAVQMSSGV